MLKTKLKKLFPNDKTSSKVNMIYSIITIYGYKHDAA